MTYRGTLLLAVSVKVVEADWLVSAWLVAVTTTVGGFGTLVGAA